MDIIINGNKRLKYIKAVYYQPVIPPSFENYLTIEPLEDNFQIQFSNRHNALYSLNGGPWTTFGEDYMSPVMNVGDKLYVKGEAPSGFSSGIFYTGQSFNVSGNCNSLIFGDEADQHFDLTGYNDCYNSLFCDCVGLKNVSKDFLSATTLADSCYSYMFQNCTSLTSSPTLPATTLATECYDSMLYGTNVLPDCSNIDFRSESVIASGGLRGLFAGTKVTDRDLHNILPINPATGKYCLPVTTLSEGCYSSMFNNCIKLVQAPELPATTLADHCYSYMFSNCSSLVTAPELPATTLAASCYHYMFRDCTSLVTAPALPATTLADSCYSSMFNNCIKLVQAPALPATTLIKSCYSSMFLNCSKLNYIKALFTTTPSSSYTYNWVKGVSGTGTFIKNANATWNVNGNNGVPAGWTVTTAVNLITFYIGNVSYQAEEGMTWEEWTNSEYNTGGYIIGGDEVSNENGNCSMYTDEGHTCTTSNEEIINGHTYRMYCNGSGD